MADHARFALTPTTPRLSRVDSLGHHLPRVGLEGVLDDLDRDAMPCLVPGAAAEQGLTWEPRDVHDRTWWPQGVAALRGGDVLLVAWYAQRRWGVLGEGARVTVVDRSDPRRPRYRHVLLATPRRPAGWTTFSRVSVHAGGIAVLGDLLYVADTLRGVRIFRLDDVVRVPRHASTRTAGRRPTGGWTAYGHDYVLPQVATLRQALPRPWTGSDRPLRWSFLGAGCQEGRPVLVAGEYGRKGTSPRLACYPLDAATGLPRLDDRRRWVPDEVHEGQPHRMQGAALHEGRWWLSTSSGDRRGDLHVGRPGSWRRHRGVLPIGPEDLAWSAPGERLWSATEQPGRRWVFSVDARRWAEAGAGAEGRTGTGAAEDPAEAPLLDPS